MWILTQNGVDGFYDVEKGHGLHCLSWKEGKA